VNLSGGTIVAGTVVHTHGGRFNFTGGTLHVETFDGNLVNSGGTLAPGSSAGLTTITGDYTQDANSILEIEIGGTDANDYDVLAVAGLATLAGTLDVSLIDGFEPNWGDTFDVVSAASILEDGLALDDPTGQFAWRLEAGSTILRLTYGLMGDVNGDGNVDNLDITPFIQALLLSEAEFDANYPDGEYWAADVNADGNVDNIDITPFIHLLTGGGQAIPEPTSAALLVLALAGILRRGKRSG
jgi:hypothetical protein